MKKALTLSKPAITGLSALAVLALWLQAPLVVAKSTFDSQTNQSVVKPSKLKTHLPDSRPGKNYNSYLLGPGDGLEIELLDLPELSGIFSIGPDGILYLPRLRTLQVDGLTVKELRQLLVQQFSTYVRNPEVYIRPVIFRPIRIYVGGEVKRPGYYTVSKETNFTTLTGARDLFSEDENMIPDSPYVRNQVGPFFPTVFDAIRAAHGITPFSNLTQVQVTRKRSEGVGGGRIRTNLNFLSLITEGNESQNIRLFDGDVVNVSRSNVVMRDQLLKAAKSNLSPQSINVFVTGRVKQAGSVEVPQGSSLNHAIAHAGGAHLIKGKVEFVRLTTGGEVERRIFSYDPGASSNAYSNPLLSDGDLIRVKDSPLNAATTVLTEITAPVLPIYSLYNLFNIIGQ